MGDPSGPGSILQTRISFRGLLSGVQVNLGGWARTLSRRLEVDSWLALSSQRAVLLGMAAMKGQARSTAGTEFHSNGLGRTATE
jgi:hypothetical protein